MEYKNEKLAARLVVKDRPTVREQLMYHGGLVAGSRPDRYLRTWEACRSLILELESEALKLDDSIEEVTDPKAVGIILWASGTVITYMNALNEVPKN